MNDKDNDSSDCASEYSMPSGRAVVLSDGPTGRTIVVNGREHRFEGEEIGRDELARLAFPGVGPSTGGSLTVAYDHGPAEAPSGLIVPGRTTRVLEGQTFSVSQTDKS